VSLLGGFAVRCECGSLELPLAAQRLVAFLALQRRPVMRACVAGQLWLSSSEERAHASLRTTLWRSRVDGHELVRSVGAHLCLAEHVHVDLPDAVDRARRLMRRASACEDRELDWLTRAGDLLPDWYDDWLVIERERFRHLRLLALEAMCERFSRAGRHAEAADAGLAAVAGEPLRESAHRALVRAHLASGNRGEALRQYRLFAALLQRQLGLAPTAEMRALVAGLPDAVTVE
jgi:DNA-binding SARP family transcriptional activator